MANKKILIVEDEILVARDIQNMLERLGYDVSGITASGEEAIKKAAEMQPDLILMDIVLRGDLDGIETAQQIRDRFNIPVVYITSYGNETTKQQAMKTKPFGFIVKPCGDRELQKTIKLALSRCRLERKS